MPLLVANCPRCGANRHTFDVKAAIRTHRQHGWQYWFETFCCCRACDRTTIFVLSQIEPSDEHQCTTQAVMQRTDSLNKLFEVERFINYSDVNAVSPPEHLPNEVNIAFEEAARSIAIGCWNAAGCMFRTAIDLATKDLLPDEQRDDLNKHTRLNLAPRLNWLFDHKLLPEALRDLASCIREDGNDAAHSANLGKEDAEDLLDFTVALLENIYTEPEKVKTALERRANRRQKKSD